MNKGARTFSVFALALATAGFSACDTKVNIVDGKLPADLVQHAQVVVGTYTGAFNQTAMTWVTEIAADNRFTLTPSAPLMKPECDSSVGRLKSISYKKNRDTNAIEITEAEFAFNSNLCSISGDTLEIEVSNAVAGAQVKLDAKLLKRVDHWPYERLPDEPLGTELLEEEVPGLDEGTGQTDHPSFLEASARPPRRWPRDRIRFRDRTRWIFFSGTFLKN